MFQSSAVQEYCQFQVDLPFKVEPGSADVPVRIRGSVVQIESTRPIDSAIVAITETKADSDPERDIDNIP